MPLLVRFRENPQSPEETRLFSTAPVRIGRNPLNDLALDFGFVSQWHGIIKFDRTETVFVDLGSTNGTCLDGVQVQERTPVRVAGPESVLSIGPLEMRLQWSDGVEEGAIRKPKIKTQFQMGLPDVRGGTGTPGSLPALGLPPAAPAPVAPGDGPSEATERGQALDAPLTAVQDVKGHYDAYREQWGRCLAAIRAKIEASPPAMREMTALFFASEFPQLTKEPEFGQMLTAVGVDRMMAGCFDIEDWLDRLTHNPQVSSAKKMSPALAMEHVGAILEVFADSFLELRKGYDQFGREMGIQVHYDQSGLDRADALDQVIAHLVDPDADQSERLNDLRRAFAGFALHQVALLGASVEGARELLDAFSPDAISASQTQPPPGSSSLALRGQAALSFLAKLWPVAPIMSWSRYQKTYESTTEEDRFTRKLFGRKFIRAYLALMGSQDTK